MKIKFPISRRHIDVKGFLFKSTEDTASRKLMPSGPDQASVCEKLKVRTCCDCIRLSGTDYIESLMCLLGKRNISSVKVMKRKSFTNNTSQVKN